MSRPITTPTNLPPSTSGFLCRLHHRHLRRGASPAAGEVELENASPDTLAIEVHMSPLQYLNLIVTGPDGSVVSKGFYGDIFSPLEEPYVLRLQPGEKYTGPVDLLGNVPDAKCVPGTYTVQAVYEYKDLRAVSEPYQLQLGG